MIYLPIKVEYINTSYSQRVKYSKKKYIFATVIASLRATEWEIQFLRHDLSVQLLEYVCGWNERGRLLWILTFQHLYAINQHRKFNNVGNPGWHIA